MIKTKAGHLIKFDNTEGSEKLLITDKSGSKITLDSKGVTIVSTKVTIGSEARCSPWCSAQSSLRNSRSSTRSSRHF